VGAGHRVELAGGWGLWRWARLRGAGFAAKRVLGLAVPGAAAAADRLIEVEAEAPARRLEVQRRLRDAQRGATGQCGTILGRALKRVRSKRPAEALACAPDHAEALAPLIDLEASLTRAQLAFEEAFARAGEQTSAALREVVLDPRFHEAVLWQNRHAMQTGCASLLTHPNRKAERLVASYFQRYCTKNDTIGFFGPNGWATVDPSSEEIVVRPGVHLLASRTVYFEYWAIDALATVIATHPELKPHLVPRQNPQNALAGDILHHPVGRETALPAVFAALLRACDGERPAHAIADLVLADRTLELDESDEVYELLATMVERGLISWTIEIPPATARPEQHLAAILDRADHARGRAMLDELERCRRDVASAAGNPEALDRALAEIATTFERLTGSAATRGHGQTYAARTIVYEDCRRDADVVLGAQFQRKLGPPLALVLQSARWFTWQIATRYERALRAIFDEFGAASVDYVAFWQRARSLFPGGFVAEVAHELHARWERILGFTDDAHVVERTVDELRGPVEREFAAPHPGWPSARHHSPDLMICARDEQALRDGSYLVVLGEVHVGMNTACVQVALEQHTEPAVLIAAREADLPEPGIAPVWSKAKTRADFYSQSRRDFELEVGETRSARPRDHVLALGELLVEDRDGLLVVRPRDAGPHFELIPFLEQHLIAESFSQFEIVGPRPHTPRIVVDGVVFARERWRFAKLELGSEQRFLAVRRWARQVGLPRHIFVKTDAEVKPIFVDLDSPILVDIMAGTIDRASTFAVSEMLPGLDDCWLSDAEQSTYTSELRVVMTDPEPWKSRGRS
jgi:Lantibiotic dehydratase, N terminus